MNWYFCIIGLFLIILAYLGGLIFIRKVYDRTSKDANIIVFYIVLLSGIGYTMFTHSFTYNDPKLIDIYRGKTDLEITYTIKSTDTISCDTLVVWKK